jgi:hypothetical protein
LQTRPLTDLVLGLICLPFWWLLGLEQMIWVPIGAIAVAKILVANRGRIRLPPFALWSVFFLLVQAASGLFIVEAFRVVTFTRNLGAYAAATLWVVVLVNSVRSMTDARRVLSACVIALAFASVIGLVGILGIWQGEFRSPMGFLLPNSVTSTTYGGHIAVRSTGGPAWFVGLGNYFRVDSVFLFPTFFATALAVTLPITLWLWRSGPRRTGRIGWAACVPLLLVNIPFTTGRIAIASLVGGSAWFLAAKRPIWALLALSVGIGGVLLAATDREIVSVASTGIEAAAYARGSGSVDTRSQVYRSTIVGFLERPILGWGTERDVPGQRYPAGSHSTYLGVVYKHGLLGFVCLLGVLASAWTTTRPDRALRGTPEHTLLRYGRWVSVVVLLNGLTDVLDLDATTLILIYTILGTLVAVRHQARVQAPTATQQ